jgi:hypothetical protein
MSKRKRTEQSQSDISQARPALHDDPAVLDVLLEGKLTANIGVSASSGPPDGSDGKTDVDWMNPLAHSRVKEEAASLHKSIKDTMFVCFFVPSYS